MNKKNKVSKIDKTQESIKKEAINTDVLGSYTGMASDGSAPVQDADDL